MTIKLARIVERDGLVFLVDKEGKELGQVVPIKPMYFYYDSLEMHIENVPGNCVPNSAVPLHAAAQVDISAALVKVPEKVGGTLGPDDFGDGWNAYLNELEGK